MACRVWLPPMYPQFLFKVQSFFVPLFCQHRSHHSETNFFFQELNKLDGHCGRVVQVCFSPDGKSLASCSDDNSIILWDVRTGKVNSRIKVKQEVKSVCFSHNTSTLAFSSGNFVYLWNLKTGKQKAKLDGHSNAVYSICYSPDGITLASGSWDESIRLWGVKTGQQKAKLDGHSSAVFSICYSPDGNKLVSGSAYNSTCLWDHCLIQRKLLFRKLKSKVNLNIHYKITIVITFLDNKLFLFQFLIFKFQD
ncbi:unnamed protein product [Paramecium octaurelia]|uniref:Uncharacterized protein n=1 Tax=Paramecium octaurelia TaxID=43137 RepID=A0A8S1UCK2_PAROT|nr:unnamed protein product [Paramecium octaurelia]